MKECNLTGWVDLSAPAGPATGDLASPTNSNQSQDNGTRLYHIDRNSSGKAAHLPARNLSPLPMGARLTVVAVLSNYLTLKLSFPRVCQQVPLH